jgi:methyl-accepting chemotaxis protein
MSEPNTTTEDIKATIREFLAEYEKQRLENSAWNKTKQFVVKNLWMILFFALLFYTFGGFRMFENLIGKFFNFQFNTAVIQRIIPDNADRQGFIERIQKLFDKEYANDDQFESDYRQTTADFRNEYPKLREIIIKNKEQLREFIGKKASATIQSVSHSRASPQNNDVLLSRMDELSNKFELLSTIKNTELEKKKLELIEIEKEPEPKSEPEIVTSNCSGGVCTPVYRSRWRR